jgi:hypothetical protein
VSLKDEEKRHRPRHIGENGHSGEDAKIEPQATLPEAKRDKEECLTTNFSGSSALGTL